MDVREIDGASNRGIDEIRELQGKCEIPPGVLALSRFTSSMKSTCSPKEAFNALLKTLEEPPPHVLFIFATTELHKIPATILSRCQRHDFRRVSVRDLSDHLRKIADAEGIEISDRALAWIAEAGDGSVRDSQSIFDQAISYAGKSIPDDAIEEILGLSDRKLVQKLSEVILNRDSRACLEIIDDGYYAGMDMKQFYSVLMANFRNLLIAKIAGVESAPIDLPDEEIERLRAIADKASRETLQRLLEFLMAEEEEVRRSLNPRLNLEFVIIKMASLEPLIPIKDVISKIESLEKKMAPGAFCAGQNGYPEDNETTFAVVKEPVAARDSKPGSKDIWELLKDRVKRESFPLWSKLEPGKLKSQDGARLRIAFPKGYFFLDFLNEKQNKDLFLKLAGEPIAEIEFFEEENGEPNNKAAEQKKNSYDLKREAINHPMVQKVMGLFEGAEIRDVIIKNGDS